ncbi:MAG: DUF1844 domain-containing protein [Candidatus Omnitrophota bacterium]|jgi:uncharacterized protein YjaG (DUF416 family)
MEEQKKNIDETWKEKAKQEKETLKGQEDLIPPEPDFNFFVSTLSLQATIFLGLIPNPATNKKEENLTQAKFLIDTIAMLKDKTKGNLTSEEEDLSENVLYELRMQYITVSESKKKP